MILSPKDLDRFLRGFEFIIKPDGTVGCWLWRNYCDVQGYGRWFIDNEPVRVHTVVCDASPGMVRDHLCRNRKCANPKHLEIVTPKENIRRGAYGVLKTHCIHGHEYTPENTIRRWADGYLKKCCRTCHNAIVRRRYRKKFPVVKMLRKRKTFTKAMEVTVTPTQNGPLH